MDINIHIYLRQPPDTAVVDGLHSILKGQQKTMATLDDIQAKQAEEKADIAALGEAFKDLLTKVAQGTIDQAKAQAILDEATAQDASVKSLIDSVKAAVPADGGGGVA